ncbi:MAG TPA: porin [Chryseosolibacter sp.]|nr:porin [Chryseosolibacter sp.]
MKNTERLLTFIFVLAISPIFGQDITNNKFGKGISVVAKDSSFSIKFGFRFQTLYQKEKQLNSGEVSENMQIRRSRIKFDGFVYDPSFEYKVELAIANSDINGGAIPQSGRTSNIVLDAYVKWNFYKDWTLWFGQAKLPGNRERVVSSQALQFVDRSNVNSRFNLDRDIGLQLHYAKRKFKFAYAMSMGEGRNITAPNAGGYNYTVRAEYLPFGSFEDKGDYFLSDFKREEKPKLSIGFTYDHNDRATRERGQLGSFIDTELANRQRDLTTWFGDAHFKYKGFSSLIEYAHRTSPENPIVFDGEGEVAQAFYTGEGINVQAGYLFKSNIEIAGRYTVVTPEKITGYNKETQYTLGLSRYFVGHSLKVQTDVSFLQEASQEDQLMYRLQLEVSF